MAVLRPDLMMKNVVPVIMAGIIAIVSHLFTSAARCKVANDCIVMAVACN